MFPTGIAIQHCNGISLLPVTGIGTGMGITGLSRFGSEPIFCSGFFLV